MTNALNSQKELALAVVSNGGNYHHGEFTLLAYWSDDYEVTIYRAWDNDGCGVESVHFDDAWNYATK